MSDAVSLTGLTVLVTRPAGQGEGLIEAIRRAGGEAVSFPLLEIKPVTDQHRQAEIRQQIQDLDQYQILIFISSNAARHGLNWISRYWPQFPVGVEVVAVGPATASALAELPCQVQTSETGMLSEDILELPVLKAVAGKKVALFRGEGGRELLADTLRDRGAQVDYVETYERQRIIGTGTELMELLQQARVNALTVTSGQILDSLCQLVDITNTGIDQIPLLVPSERIRQQAQAAGFTQVTCSHGATDSAVVAGLAEIARQLPDQNHGADSG
jgi:uroporphyrinogen-III synthase